jgi:DNA mismatch repair protein MutS2
VLWQSLDREARKRELRRDELRPLNEEVRSLEGELDAMSAPEPDASGTPPIPAEGLLPGVRVRVVDLGVDAEVLAVPDADGRIQLRRGPWTIQSHVSKLRAVQAPGAPGSPRRESGSQAAWSVPETPPALELDLRGMEVDDALKELDRGLDQAVVNGLHELRIVHGVGRGVLRAAVERHLRGHPQVAEQRLGQIGEGGRGVTLARLR